MQFRILAINPGSTSTKIALYDDCDVIFTDNLSHSDEKLASFSSIAEQFPYRRDLVLQNLEEHKIPLQSLSATVGRGGMLPPVHVGGYRINTHMKNLITSGQIPEHASNLGALIADAIAVPLSIPSFIYDAVSANELMEIATVTGFPEIRRHGFAHVLNARAMGRKLAESKGKKYEEMNLLVAHIGGGISITAHEKGKIIDVISDDDGPFSPERSGSIPLFYILDMCYSGQYDKKTMSRKLRGAGGMKAHLGTHDCQEAERRIAAGDEYAALVYEAMAYQICKGIGELSAALSGNIDFILLTGGAAYSKMLTEWVRKRISFIAPVEILPGENEMESLAFGALRILRGEEETQEF